MRNSSINPNLFLSDTNSLLSLKKLDGLKEKKVKLQNKESLSCKKCGKKMKENTQEKELTVQTVNNLSITNKEFIQKHKRKKVDYFQRKTRIFSPHKKTLTLNIVKLSKNFHHKYLLSLVSV